MSVAGSPNAEVGWQFVTSIHFPPISFDSMQHKLEGVKELIEATGAELRYLPLLNQLL